MASSSEFNLSSVQLYADEAERLLICCHNTCQYALSVAGSQVTSHLRDKHQIPQDLRNGPKSVYPTFFRNPIELPPRDNGSQIHPQLRIYDGFACRECSYLTINYEEYSQHFSKEHLSGGQASRKRTDSHYDDVYLQTWTRSSCRKYWTVQKDGSTMRPLAGQGVSEHMRQVHQREHQRTEAQARASNMSTATPTFAGSRPWMERMRWEITYQGRSLDILRNLTEMPRAHFGENHILGRTSNAADPELVSPRDDEARIALAMVAIDYMLNRCEKTMQHTGRTILCWLRSTKPQTCYPKPFTLVSLNSSKKKYRQLLKRFFAFIFRVYQMPVDIRRSLVGVRFKKEQLRQIQAVWEHRAWSDIKHEQGGWLRSQDRSNTHNDKEGESEDGSEIEDSSDEDDGDIEAGMDKEQSNDDGDQSADEYEEAQEYLENNCGILGLSSDARSFQPAKKYTPHLSALIYVQRLLFLEHALPLRPYRHLGIPRRSPFRQHQHFDVVRQRYMITGSPSPLEEFQSLRDFGRVIARTDPPSFLLRWSDDGETVSYGDHFSLTMTSFRALAEHFLVKAEKLCDNLMFGLEPDIDLALIKDDLVNTQRGFSFVQHPANKLAKAYLDLSSKACTTRRHGLFRKDRWDWNAISIYRKTAELLQKSIGGIFETSGGQTARVSELVTLECENGLSTERGLYVYNGSLIFIIRHHKAKRSTNREFNVVRFLPGRGGHIVFKYLVYIRPFLEMLRREQCSRSEPQTLPSSSNLLFGSHHAPHKCWDSSRFTSILKKATTEVWNIPVNIQLYRQLTIGITEKHVREVSRPFNGFDDETTAADINVVFAWQSGHRPIQRATTYGLDGAFPAQLQPALLRVYEWASTRWHEFLHQSSKTVPPPTVVVVRGSAESLSTTSPPSSPDTTPRPAKRKSPPRNHDELSPARPRKRIAATNLSSLPNSNSLPLARSKGRLPGTEPHAASGKKVPAHPAEIISRAYDWEDGAGGNPLSDDESDSSIDWDEPDMIPSDAPTDRSRPSWSRAPRPSWRRHKQRIEAKIHQSRQFHGVMDVVELRDHEQEAMRHLHICLDMWSQCCIICDFTGNPNCQHLIADCPDLLSRGVQLWAPLFLAKLQSLAKADTQSCSVCLVPKLICNRWKADRRGDWVDTGVKCKYDKDVTLTIVTALEASVEVRKELDTWIDPCVHSRNLDKVCQWLSGQTVGNALYAMRVMQVFTLVSGAWGRLASSNKGSHSPVQIWITSTGDPTEAEDAADNAAYMLREKKRQSDRARIQREGRDESDIDGRLISWMGKCPICHIQTRLGFDVDTDHDIEMCPDIRRKIVAIEIAKFRGIKFKNGVCCQQCGVPQEMCDDSIYLSRDGERECSYSGIIREAIATMMVVGPDLVVEKMYAWMRSKGIWLEDAISIQDEVPQVTQEVLEWFSQKATWRSFTWSVLLEVFNQLDRWIEAFEKGLELEDWLGAD